MLKLIAELKSVLHSPTYYVITIVGGIGFEFRWISSIAFIFIVWFWLSSIDIALWWYNAVVRHKNNSRDFTNGLVKKAGEMIIGLMLSFLIAHVNVMVWQPWLSLVLWGLSIGIPVLFMYGEVQSILENLLILDGRKSKILLFFSKWLWLALDIVWDKIQDNIEEKLGKEIWSNKLK